MATLCGTHARYIYIARITLPKPLNLIEPIRRVATDNKLLGKMSFGEAGAQRQMEKRGRPVWGRLAGRLTCLGLPFELKTIKGRGVALLQSR